MGFELVHQLNVHPISRCLEETSTLGQWGRIGTYSAYIDRRPAKTWTWHTYDEWEHVRNQLHRTNPDGRGRFAILVLAPCYTAHVDLRISFLILTSGIRSLLRHSWNKWRNCRKASPSHSEDLWGFCYSTQQLSLTVNEWFDYIIR